MSVATVPRTRAGLYMPLSDQALGRHAERLRDLLYEPRESRSEHVVTSRRASTMERFSEAILKAARRQEDVTSEAFWRAQCLLSSLPQSLPLPDVFIDEDGEVGLDWDEDRRRVVSVIVGDTPLMRYSALIGADRFSGRMVFDGTMPTTLSDLLRRLYPARAADQR